MYCCREFLSFLGSNRKIEAASKEAEITIKKAESEIKELSVFQRHLERKEREKAALAQQSKKVYKLFCLRLCYSFEIKIS